MGSFSVWHWLIVLAVVLLLFGGRGKISQLMGDFGKGLSAFKKGVGAGQDEGQQQAQDQPGDTAKPISAQTTTTPPGGEARQDSTAKV
jgi:sec-independent protein translocase protein TatA